MKRWLLLLSLMTACPFSLAAAPLPQETPSSVEVTFPRLILYHSSQGLEYYIDMASLSPLPAAPPQYVLTVATITRDSIHHLDVKSVNRYEYNYLTKKMLWQQTETHTYDETGNEITRSAAPQPPKELTPDSPWYQAGCIAFIQAYNLSFIESSVPPESMPAEEGRS